jgi:hypothetical protein
MSIAELEQAQAESGESEESSEEIMRIQASENHELMDAVFEMETGKSYKDEGERMIKNAKEVLSNRAREELNKLRGTEKELPKQFAFATETYTAWINTRPNGYGVMTAGMVDDLVKIDESIKDHIKVTTGISVKWGSIPEDKQGEVGRYLMGLNKIVYGEQWKPSKAQPTLVVVTKERKAKTDSFYSNQFCMDNDKMLRMQELLPVPFAIASKTGRAK